MNNLIDKYPDKAAEMKKMCLDWAHKVNVPDPPGWIINGLKQENRLDKIPEYYRNKID